MYKNIIYEPKIGKSLWTKIGMWKIGVWTVSDVTKIFLSGALKTPNSDSVQPEISISANSLLVLTLYNQQLTRWILTTHFCVYICALVGLLCTFSYNFYFSNCPLLPIFFLVVVRCFALNSIKLVYVFMCRANLVDEKWELWTKTFVLCLVKKDRNLIEWCVKCKVLKMRIKMSVICRNYRPFSRVHKRAKHRFIWKSALGFIN